MLFRRAKLPLRTPPEVATRCVVLRAVIAAAFGHDRDGIVESLHRNHLWDAVSEEEKTFLADEISPRFNPRWMSGDMQRRKEAVMPLLWALRCLDQLPSPAAPSEFQVIESLVPPWTKPMESFVSAAVLRPAKEIHQVRAEVLDMHWHLRDAALGGDPPPADFHPDVVPERHHAFNWLCSCDEDWDEIVCDT